MELRIVQTCPGCGAAIELHEDDRLVTCPFCELKNYRLETGPERYVLPWTLPSNVHENQLQFVPYIRFKGAVFYTTGMDLRHKLVDATRLALNGSHLPASLRLRPQAMHVKPVVAGMVGKFLEQEIKTGEILEHVTKLSTLFFRKNKQIMQYREFIGESLSRIYLPVYSAGEKLIDAVDGRDLGDAGNFIKWTGNGSPAKRSWEPRFISTLCPRCGGLLSGERDSLVLGCENCETLWQEHKGRFQLLKWKVISAADADAVYLPFWKITFQTRKGELRSFADFLRMTNQPVLVEKADNERHPAFWIPAFKINPKAFLQISTKATVAQKHIPPGRIDFPENAYPVTFPWREAFQALKSVLAAAAVSRKNIFPLLPRLRICSAGYALRYLPFTVRSHDLVQQHIPVTVVSAALKYGRSL
ncbi:hypothetical protein [Desulfomarina sp.]